MYIVAAYCCMFLKALVCSAGIVEVVTWTQPEEEVSKK